LDFSKGNAREKREEEAKGFQGFEGEDMVI